MVVSSGNSNIFRRKSIESIAVRQVLGVMHLHPVMIAAANGHDEMKPVMPTHCTWRRKGDVIGAGHDNDSRALLLLTVRASISVK